jgi:hypothetical protein
MIVPRASRNAEPARPVRAPHTGPRPRAPRAAILVPALCVAGALPLVGCSSGSPAAAAAATSAAVARTCAQVGAVLSDGPDPTADPVGYAEAQILPLRQVRAADAQLRTAISKLAGAYETFFAANGKSAAATAAVVTAGAHVNRLCPGAGAGA